MPISLRFPIALMLSIVFLGVPAWADYQAGLDSYKGGDYATALREWRPLANQGNVMAQSLLGAMYYEGKGVLQNYIQAGLWLHAAAIQGNAGAQYYLGVMYHNGHGAPQDFVQAHMWYNLAEANGHNDAAMFRDVLEKQMTFFQILDAQQLARKWREWTPKTP